MRLLASTLLLLLAIPVAAVAFATEPAAVEVGVSDEEAINALCPIAGEAIDGSTFVTYEGHRIGFCCAGCDTKFLAWSKADKDAFVSASLAQEGEEAEVEEMAVELYTATRCPVSGEPLGSMGDPIVVTVEGREAKLCCGGCRKAFLAEPAKHFALIDEEHAEQQTPYYPMATCVVSGEPLVVEGEDVGVDVVVNNRLFRVCCDSCVAPLRENPARFRDVLNEKAAESQRANYPLQHCIVRGEKSKLGSMGEPHEIVVGNRLVRFCCAGCVSGFNEKAPELLATLDAAWVPVRESVEGESDEQEESSEGQ